VALVRHAVRLGPLASLLHDVSEGGLAVALAGRSGQRATLDLDDDP
jgi:hypothetical protein